jgi:uncharacterized protein YrrD
MIHETDGHIGDVADFIIDDSTWRIDYLVVDTGSWLPGKKVLLSPRMIRSMDWMTSMVHVNESKEQLRHSPEFDAEHFMTDAYQKKLQDYYHDDRT